MMSPDKRAQKRFSQDMSAKSATTNWRTLYRIGGWAAWLTVLVGLLEIAVTFLPGGNGTYETVQEWFTLLQQDWFMGLRNLGLLNMALIALSIPIFFALYGAQRHVNHTIAALALIVALIGVTVFYATNRALPMLALSHQSALATSEGDRAILAAAGVAMLAVGRSHTPGTFIAFALGEVSGIVMAGVMLQSSVFGKGAAYTGLLGFAFLLLFEVCASFVPSLGTLTLGSVPMTLAIIGGLLNMTWEILIARRLFQLAHAGDLALAPLSERRLLLKGKEAAAVFGGEWRAIFTRFKGFGVLHGAPTRLAIGGDEFVAIEVGGMAETIAALCAQPGAPLVGRGWHLFQIASVIGQPLVHLRGVTVQRIQL